jgi:DUF1365 family protein
MTMRVIRAIHRQALKLWVQGVSVFTYPAYPRAESNAAPVPERGGRIAGALKGDFAR